MSVVKGQVTICPYMNFPEGTNKIQYYSHCNLERSALALFAVTANSGQQIFGLVFFILIFSAFLDVFWCAESENDVSIFVVSAVFL